jgi:HPt (histidine-containing phosphotransfer) domain-containing protein
MKALRDEPEASSRRSPCNLITIEANMGSAPEPSRAAKLVSQLLLEDGDLRDIVEEFIVGLDVRIHELQQAHERLDWEQLTTLAHRLKGAAGSYGYPDISRLCAEMEQHFRSHTTGDFARWMTQLALLTDAAREGLSEGP